MKRNITFLLIIFSFLQVSAQQFWGTQIDYTGVSNVLLDIHFINNNQGFATGKDGIVISTYNAGETWEVLKEEKGTDFNAFVTNGERLFVASEFSRSQYSKDSGNNWIDWNLSSEKEYQLLDVDMKGNNMVAVGATVVGLKPAIFISTNYIKWDLITDHSIPENVFIRDVFMLDENNGFIITDQKDRIHLTTNGGGSWHDIPAQGLQGASAFTSMFFVNQSTGFITTTTGSVYKTINGGSSWVEIKLTTKAFYTVEFFDENIGAIASQEGVYITEDGGDSWNLFGDGTAVRSLFFKDNNTLLGVGSGGKVYTFKALWPLSSEDIYQANEVVILANPVRQGNDIKIVVKSGVVEQIMLTTMDGRLVYKTDNLINSRLLIPTGNLAEGVYLVTVQYKNAIKSLRIVVGS